MNPALAEAHEVVAEFRKSRELPTGRAYRHVPQTLFPVAVVPIVEVEPFERAVGVPGLVRSRAHAILIEMSENVPLYPVNVYDQGAGPCTRKFKLYHGFHRYYLSLAVGFTHLPVVINPSGGADAL